MNLNVISSLRISVHNKLYSSTYAHYRPRNIFWCAVL